MQILFTDMVVQRLKVEGKQIIYWDSNLPSFGVRVGKKTKTFVVMWGKDRKTETVGRYPDLSLKDARIKAKALLVQRSTPSSTYEPIQYEKAVVRFLEAHKGRLKPSTIDQYGFYLRKMAFKKNVHEIGKGDVADGLAIWQGKAHAQNYAHSSLRAFLNWCLDQEMIEKHPLLRSKEPNKVRSRARVLSDDEIGKIWRATDDTPYGRILRVLILTGQRRNEVGNLKPEDVQDGLITFHTKGDKQNILPVTPEVEKNLILPFKFNNFADSKSRFDDECGVYDWTHHDCRRTLATKLASLDVPVIVIERILGHSYGGKVFQTYQRHTYLPQVQEALLRYEAHVLKVASLGQC